LRLLFLILGACYEVRAAKNKRGADFVRRERERVSDLY